MLGAIIGDVVGSAYEGSDIKGTSLPLTPPAARITDDTILMAAIADALLDNRDYAERLRFWGRAHRDAGFGPGFEQWLDDDSRGSYGSAGNGAAVRAIPIGWLARSEQDVRDQAYRATVCTHDHEASHRGAEAMAMAVFRLRRGDIPQAVFREISLAYDYDYDFDLDLEALHRDHGFDAHCDTSVPIAFAIARHARSFGDAMAKGLYVGGDTDSILAMAGALREAMAPNALPAPLVEFTIGRIRRDAPEVLRVLGRVRPALLLGR